MREHVLGAFARDGAQDIGEFLGVARRTARRASPAAGGGAIPRPSRAAHPGNAFDCATSLSISARSSATGSLGGALSFARGGSRSRARSCRSRSCRSRRRSRRDSSASMSASERRRQASGVAPVSLSRATRCSLGAAARARRDAAFDPLQRSPPVVGAGKIDAKRAGTRATLVRRSSTVIVRSSPIVDQRRRLRPRLVDVAPLRIARHHDRRPAPLHEPLMDVAERPIVEARAMEIGGRAGRVEVVRGRAAEARVQHADIDARRRRGGAELRQQALGRVPAGETDAVNRDVEPAARERHGFRAPGKDLDRIRQGQLPGDARLGVVIAADDEGRDRPPRAAAAADRRESAPSSSTSVRRRRGRPRSGARRPVPQGRDRSTRRRLCASPRRSVRRAPDRAAPASQRRIEVDVGGVDELEGHGLIGARLRKAAKSRVRARWQWISAPLSAAAALRA